MPVGRRVCLQAKTTPQEETEKGWNKERVGATLSIVLVHLFIKSAFSFFFLAGEVVGGWGQPFDKLHSFCATGS